MLLSRQGLTEMLGALKNMSPTEDSWGAEKIAGASDKIGLHFSEADDKRGLNEREYLDLCEEIGVKEPPSFQRVFIVFGEADAFRDSTATRPSAATAFDPTVAVPSAPDMRPEAQTPSALQSNASPDVGAPPSSDEGAMVVETDPPPAQQPVSPRRPRVAMMNPVMEIIAGLSGVQIALLMAGMFFIIAIIAGLTASSPSQPAFGAEDSAGWMRPNAATPRIKPPEAK